MTASSGDTARGLQELARQVRGGTLEILAATPGPWLTWSPPGTSNHILWHAGHALWLQDVLSIRPLTGESELPNGWAGRFGQSSQPSSAGEDWPAAEKVAARLAAQRERLVALYVEHAATIAARGRQAPAAGGWPLLSGIVHGWHDEARHQGEMYLLFKLCRAGRPK